MYRREVLGVAVSAALAGCSSAIGGGEPEPRTEQRAAEAPPGLEDTRELAEELHRALSGHHDGVHVYFNRDDELAAEYDSRAGSADELEAELHRIAALYADLVDEGGHGPRTLSIVTGEVQAVVPGPSLERHVEGGINREAFLETVEVIGVERGGD